MDLQPAEPLKNLKVLTSIITDFSWNPLPFAPSILPKYSIGNWK